MRVSGSMPAFLASAGLSTMVEAPVSTIMDTGASTIVLRPADARKAGIDPDTLIYRVPVLTANGRAMAARVRLDTVAIGPLDRKDVDALVAQPGALTQSLLG